MGLINKISKKTLLYKLIYSITVAVIAGLILGFLDYALPSLFTSVWWFTITVFISIYNYLGSTTDIYNWLWILLVIISGFFIIILILKILSTLKESDINDYRCDIFYKLKCRWTNYIGEIIDLKYYCPECDIELIPKKSIIGINNTGHPDYEIKFKCRCNKFEKKFKCQDINYITNDIVILIEQKKHNDGWKEAIKEYN